MNKEKLVKITRSGTVTFLLAILALFTFGAAATPSAASVDKGNQRIVSSPHVLDDVNIRVYSADTQKTVIIKAHTLGDYPTVTYSWFAPISCQDVALRVAPRVGPYMVTVQWDAGATKPDIDIDYEP